MAVDLAVAGVAGLKSLAAAKTASVASKIAAAHALGLAKYSAIAAAEAAKAQQNLETYVYGAPVSTTPSLLTPYPKKTRVPLPSHPSPLGMMGGGMMGGGMMPGMMMPGMTTGMAAGGYPGMQMAGSPPMCQQPVTSSPVDESDFVIAAKQLPMAPLLSLPASAVQMNSLSEASTQMSCCLLVRRKICYSNFL